MITAAQILAARQQLEALRLQADVLAGTLDTLAAQAAASALSAPAPTCPHPEEARTDAGTLTNPRRFWCRACQTFNDAPLEEVAPSGLRP